MKARTAGCVGRKGPPNELFFGSPSDFCFPKPTFRDADKKTALWGAKRISTDQILVELELFQLATPQLRVVKIAQTRFVGLAQPANEGLGDSYERRPR
jgi:hypothetical protein